MKCDNQEIRSIRKTTNVKRFLNQGVKEFLSLILSIGWFKTHNHTQQSRKLKAVGQNRKCGWILLAEKGPLKQGHCSKDTLERDFSLRVMMVNLPLQCPAGHGDSRLQSQHLGNWGSGMWWGWASRGGWVSAQLVMVAHTCHPSN